MTLLTDAFAKGTHAARPAAAAGNKGFYYFETDTQELFQSDGSAWTQIASIGGASPLTTKGDLFGHGTVDARIPVGTDGQVLTADSTQTLGLKWATAAGGGGGLSGQIDTPPVSANSHDAEFTGGPGLPTGYSIAVASGSLTNAQIAVPLANAPSAPTYNVNEDAASGILMQPQSAGIMKLYRTFAPTVSTDWAFIVKASLWNIVQTDDRIHCGLTKTGETITSADEPDNSAWMELRCASGTTTGVQMGDYSKFGGGLNGRENTSDWWRTSAYFLWVGKADNSIWAYNSEDGLTWRGQQNWSGQTLNSNVGFAWISVGGAAGSKVGMVVDYMRFLEGASNPYRMHG